MSEDSNKSSIKFDVGASARAEAKLNVTTEVPAVSTGRAVDAFIDIFRPFTESRGLRADHIRLQRMDVAIEMARKAQEIASIENAPILPVPNKILIPLLEKSSLEDIGDEVMVNKWAALLASAATEKDVHPRHIQLLSELTGREIELLERIALNNSHAWQDPLYLFREAYLDIAPGSWTYEKVLSMSDGVFLPEIEVLDIMDDIFNAPGRMMVSLQMQSSRGDTFVKEGYYDHKLKQYLGLCVGMGLLRREEVRFHPQINGYSLPLKLIYYCLTEIAIGLIEVSSPKVMSELNEYHNKNLFRKSPDLDHYYYIGNLLIVFKSKHSNDYVARGKADESVGLFI